MYEILKRALDEALTAAYAEEIPVGAEEVAFSESFEREMRGLVRKMDRPIQKYIPILTAAACAVIAIGCAVLLPRLLSNSVSVETSGIGDTTVVSPALIDEPAESTSAQETGSDVPGEVQDENPGAAGGVADTEEDTTAWDDDDDDVSAENGVPAETSTSVAAPEPMTQDPNDFPATGVDNPGETTADDGDDSVEADTAVSDDADIGGDSAEEETEVEEDDAESDVVDEGDDADYDSEEAVDESELPPIVKRDILNEDVQALIGCSLADSYLHSGNFMIDGKFYDLPIIGGIDPETYRDPELAKLIGAAKYVGDEPEEIGLSLFWGNIGKEAPVIKPVYESDQSDRNHYDEIYFGEDFSIEDEEDEIDTPVETVYLEIWQNGIVSVRMEGYRGAAYYRLDDEALEKLTARIETRFKVSEPKTVSELSEQIGSAEDYAQIYVSINRYYDCTMFGALTDGLFFAELLEKYKDEKLREPDGLLHGNTPIRINLTSRKTLQTKNFDFYADGTVIVSGTKTFTVDEAELRVILTEYCRQKNLPAPVFYETLGEYLTGKNFTALTEAMFHGKDAKDDLRLGGDSAELRVLIEEYASKSAYLPSWRDSSREQGSVEIRVEGWYPYVRIDRDVIVIAYWQSWNFFETPDGLYDKLCAVISEKGESPYAEQDENYFDDDVAYEEIVED